MIIKTANIIEVIEKYPQVADVLTEYGLHCVACTLAKFETIEQGARAHGLNADQIDHLVEIVNIIISKKADYPLNPDGITISPTALETLKLIKKTENKSKNGLKIKAEKLTSGLDYYLDLKTKPHKDDQTLSWQGLDIFVDSQTMKMIKPCIVDYIQTPSGEGFKVILLK